MLKVIQGTALKTSVRFLAFDSIKNVLADSSGKLSAGKGVLAGMAAGAVESVTAVTPTERIKTALSVYYSVRTPS
jgi:solute carrier family 25 (mitochondrial citrate transporter), member 1